MKYFERVLWVLLAAALYVAWLTFVGNDASRDSFSPDTLETRSRSERSVGITVWPGTYRYRKAPLIEYLIANDYVQPITTTEPRWIVMGFYSSQWRDGQGHLAYVFSWQQEKTIAWCEADPERARLLWSTVFPLLRSSNEKEVQAGQVIARLGVREQTVQELQQCIDRTLNEFGITRSTSRQAIAP